MIQSKINYSKSGKIANKQQAYASNHTKHININDKLIVDDQTSRWIIYNREQLIRKRAVMLVIYWMDIPQ